MKLGIGSLSSGMVCALVLAACSGAEGSLTEDPADEAQSAVSNGNPTAGKHEFDNALPHTNGRACATCHVESEHLALGPQHVTALYLQDPHDPLFNRIDADDPDAAVLTYDHLKAGLW